MSDALERLKRRNRPTVPSQNASPTPASIDLHSLDTSIPRHIGGKIATSQDSAGSLHPGMTQPLETKQSTLRLERGVSDRLHDVCRENSICREVLIEAMLEYCEAHPEALQTALSEARKKNEQRQQIANQKRAKTMMQRFGQSD